MPAYCSEPVFLSESVKDVNSSQVCRFPAHMFSFPRTL